MAEQKRMHQVVFDPAAGTLVDEQGQPTQAAQAPTPSNQAPTETSSGSIIPPGLLEAAKTATGAMTLDPMALKKLISGVIQSPTAMSMGGAYALPAAAAWLLGPELGLPVDMILAGAGSAGGDIIGSKASGQEAHPGVAGAIGALGAGLPAAIEGTGKIMQAGKGYVGRGLGALAGALAGETAGHPYLGIMMGERAGAYGGPFVERMGQALSKIAPGTGKAAQELADPAVKAWDEAASKLVVDGRKITDLPASEAQQIAEKVFGPRPGGGTSPIFTGKAVEAIKPKPRLVLHDEIPAAGRFHTPSAEEIAAGRDPEGAAGLKGPQTIRGRSAKLPANPNPGSITQEIERALKLERGDETAHLSADQLANREHTLGAIRRMSSKAEPSTASDEFAKVRLKKVGKQAMNAEKGSSHIIGSGYDANSQTLTVQFHNGRVYRYKNITPDVAQAFADAESKGKFIANVLRADPESFPASEVRLRKPGGKK